MQRELSKITFSTKQAPLKKIKSKISYLYFGKLTCLSTFPKIKSFNLENLAQANNLWKENEMGSKTNKLKTNFQILQMRI